MKHLAISRKILFCLTQAQGATTHSASGSHTWVSTVWLTLPSEVNH